MSEQYDNYIYEHKSNVGKAYTWLLEHHLIDGNYYIMLNLVNSHDASKFSEEEYNAYDTYFYGNNITPEEQENFNAA